MNRFSRRPLVALLSIPTLVLIGVAGAVGETPAAADAGLTTTVLPVPGAFLIRGMACPTADTCIAVGYSGSSSEDSYVVTITDGVAGTPEVVPYVFLFDIACTTTTTCLAVGQYNGLSGQSYNGVVLPVIGGLPGSPITVPNVTIRGVTCEAATACEAVGQTAGNVGMFVDVVNGIPGTVQEVSGTYWLVGISCVGITCEAVGQVYDLSAATTDGVAVTISSGVAGTVQVLTSAEDLNGVACTAANSCIVVGGTQGLGGLEATVLDGVVETPTVVSTTAVLTAIACPVSDSCDAVGYSNNYVYGTLGAIAGVVDLIDNGAASAPQLISGTQQFWAAACPTSTTCEGAGSTFPANGDYVAVAVSMSSGPAPTVTSLASSSNSIVFGEPVTYTASVAGNLDAPGPQAEGTITFQGSAGVLCGGPVALSNGEASCTTSYLGVGSDSVVATYSGGPDWLGSSSAALDETIAPDPTTTSVQLSASSPAFGQSLTLSAQVAAQAPGSGTPTGSVHFLQGSTTVGTASLDAAGQAALSVTDLLPQGGTDAFTATYAGSPDYLASTSSTAILGVTYSSCITGNHSGPLTVASGQAVCISGNQSGPVTVSAGGALSVQGGRVSGPLQSSGASALELCGATISGPVTIANSAGPVLIEGSSAGCSQPTTISGPLTLAGNIGGLAVGNTRISGPLSLTGSTGAVPILEGNTISGPLACSGNSPAPSDSGVPNTVSGARSGQCAAPGF